MTKTEELLIEARDIAHRTLGADVPKKVVGQVFDVLVFERMPEPADKREAEPRTLH